MPPRDKVSGRSGFAGDQLCLDVRTMAVERAPDEDRLAARRPLILQPEPGELPPAAGEVEETVPVPRGEADQALGAQDVRGQPGQDLLEGLLAKRTGRAIEEAPHAICLEMAAHAM